MAGYEYTEADLGPDWKPTSGKFDLNSDGRCGLLDDDDALGKPAKPSRRRRSDAEVERKLAEAGFAFSSPEALAAYHKGRAY